MEETKSISKIGIALVLLIVTIIAISSTAYVVGENEYAYITRFSKFVKIQDTAGLHLKMPF